MGLGRGVYRSGIPHLAKNERDMGHRSLVAGIEFEGFDGVRLIVFGPHSSVGCWDKVLKVLMGSARSFSAHVHLANNESSVGC
jgi:hypothetical protein